MSVHGGGLCAPLKIHSFWRVLGWVGLHAPLGDALVVYFFFRFQVNFCFSIRVYGLFRATRLKICKKKISEVLTLRGCQVLLLS